MRLEAIKHQILTKLGLRTRPDVNRTLATVPRHLALETLYRAEAQFSRYPLPDNTRNDRREDVYSTEFLYGGNEYSYSRNLDQRVDDDSAKDNGRIASSYRGYEGGEGEDREPEEEIDDFYARTSEIITFAEPGKYSPLRSISGSIFVPRTIGRVEARTRPTLPRTLPRYLSILDSNFFIYLSPFYLRTFRRNEAKTNLLHPSFRATRDNDINARKPRVSTRWKGKERTYTMAHRFVRSPSSVESACCSSRERKDNERYYRGTRKGEREKIRRKRHEPTPWIACMRGHTGTATWPRRYGCRATTVYSSFRSSVTLSLTIRVIELNSEGRKKRAISSTFASYRDESIAFVIVIAG